MCSLRAFLAIWLGVSLCLSGSDSWRGPNVPRGILMVAYEARLNPAEAAADASLFDDETLSTEPEGMVGIRAGQARVSLGGSTVASLHPLADGKTRGRSPASKGRASEASRKSRFLARRYCRSVRGAEPWSFPTVTSSGFCPKAKHIAFICDAPEDSGSGALNESPGIS